MKNVISMMSPRMMMIVKSIKPCSKVFDTGTDHAFIPIYLIQNNICETAVASDVKIGPVNVAKKNIKKFEMEDSIATSLCDGIENAVGFDCIVIAGMGGQLICDILDREIDIARSSDQLILQAMNAPEKLRKYLWKNGFSIQYENLCSEKNKVYNVICARYIGESTEYTETELHVSKYLLEVKHTLLHEYLQPKIKRLNDMISGGNNFGSRNSKLLLKIKELMK